MADAPIQTLISLGFTPTEAAVYAVLLAGEPTTGYAIAREIGKPVANTYKAIESLQNKGAVLIDDGERRVCRAVPAGELIRRMRRTYQDRCARAEKALTTIDAPQPDDRVYPIRTRAQFIERCRAMLAGAQRAALIDAFPEPLAELAPDLAAAASRAVRVVVLAYEPIEIAGARVIVAHPQTGIERLFFQTVSLVTDGREHARAMLAWDNADILHAIWTGSLLLSCLQHDDLICQIFTKQVELAMRENASMDVVRAAFDDLRAISTRHTLGYEAFASRFARAAAETTP